MSLLGKVVWVTDTGITMSVATKNCLGKAVLSFVRLHKQETWKNHTGSGRSHTASHLSQKPQALNAKFLLKALILLFYIYNSWS